MQRCPVEMGAAPVTFPRNIRVGCATRINFGFPVRVSAGYISAHCWSFRGGPAKKKGAMTSEASRCQWSDTMSIWEPTLKLGAMSLRFEISAVTLVLSIYGRRCGVSRCR